MLLTPGLAIIFGGIKYKEQQFNPASTGISSTLLIISVIGVFSPTIYYLCFGSYTLDCGNCSTLNGTVSCQGCTYTEVDMLSDPVYEHGAKPLMYTSCIIMPIAYLIGMMFTLKTHSHLFEDEVSEAEGKFFPALFLILFSGRCA
jgi:Ca2+:H+ antiporter